MADLEPGTDTATNEIAALLQARWDAPPEPEPADDGTPEPQPAPAAPATPEQDPIPAEATPSGDTPSEPSKDEPTPPAITVKAPEPVKAPEAAPKASEPSPTAKRLSDLTAAIPLIRAQIATEFSDIKTTDDLLKVANEDPARALRFKLHNDRLQEVDRERNLLLSMERSQWEAGQRAILVKELPELADPVKGPVLRDRLTAVAKSRNYSDEAIANASADDVLMLHEILVARDAKAAIAKSAADQAAAIKEANKKAANAPPVQKPGTQRTADGDEKVKGLQERFSKTGHLDDLTALLVASGIA